MHTTWLALSLAFAATPVERAKAALDPFQKTLKDALLAALAKSPEAAVAVCAKEAPELAKAASRDGVVVGRSANRLRNASNAPSAWVKEAMTKLSKAKSGTDAHVVMALPEGRVGYAQAIWLAPPCVTCHGKAIAPALDAKIKAAYPQDEARGYDVGDFRGVFWAEVTTK